MKTLARSAVALAALSACADPDRVIVQLSPEVISSLTATTDVAALVTGVNGAPLADSSVTLTVSYFDRNGIEHDVPEVKGTTNARGLFETKLEELRWDGAGTVTVAADGVIGTTTFSVLDRTPPKIEILAPTSDRKVGAGLPLDVRIKVSDEIGVSRVTLDATGGVSGTRSTVVSDAAVDTTITFRMSVPAGATPGPTIKLYAIAEDLSGNLAAATSMELTVDPTITIATPPGLMGMLLADGTAQRLVNPRSVAVSAKDGKLYIADQAQVTGCTPSCIWRVDPATGQVDAAPVVVGAGQIEGVAFDANGDNLYYTDRQRRIGRLTWNGSAYAGAVVCNDTTQGPLQDPYHLVFDPNLGLLAADDNAQEVVRVATCAAATVATTFSTNGNFDAPRGFGSDGTAFYIADQNRDRVSKISATGTVTTFEAGIQEPYGVEWYGGSVAPWAGSLMVASTGDRIVASTRGGGPLAAAYLRNTPVDLAFAGNAMFVLTSPSSGNRGRVYKVTGF